MISQCPHCEQALSFSPAQMEKFKQALAKLSQGRTLKFGCPKCKTPIELSREGGLADKKTGDGPRPKTAVHPPKAPDLDWLNSDKEEQREVLDDVPTAMILIKDGAVLDQVGKVLENNRFQIHSPRSTDEAVESLRFREYAVVAYSTDCEQGPMEVHDFHKFMSAMSMNKRRKIFYLILGDEVRTLYNLEALAMSANLLVNLRDLPYFDKIFTKGVNEYESLFTPYISMLKQHGKS